MKKFMLFLMVAIPILVILLVNLTATVAVGDVFISVERVTLNHTDVSAKVGESVDLSASIYPKIATNKDVMWFSTNEEAAQVDENGHVNFVGIGEGYISAVTIDGNKRSSCSFYVWDTKVHRVELKAPRNYLGIGEKMKLTATVKPDEALNKDVEYTSSDPTIAEVDSNGNVLGLREGEVRITVTTDDGGYTNFVDLEVLKPVEDLQIEQKEIITSSSTVQIEYLVKPDDATNKAVLFEVDNPEIADVNHMGQVTFKKRGQVMVTARTEIGDITRQIKIIYTEGYAYDMTLITARFINMSVESSSIRLEYQITPSNLYNAKVEFLSSDEDVAYVDSSGYLHSVAGGSAVITVRVESAPGEYIEREIYVSVESPAKEIEIEDLMTADKTCQLNPRSLPADSTNKAYYYHIIEGDKATVSPNGLVVFTCQEAYTITVAIYANEDYSDVSKTIKVTYTAGMAGEFHLVSDDIIINYGDTIEPAYETTPSNAIIRPLTFSIESESPNKAGGRVIEIVDGRIHAIGGGTAVVKAMFVLYDETVSEQLCRITVLRAPTEVIIDLGLQYYNNQYVTAERVVSLVGEVAPEDASQKNIAWSVSGNIAVIRDNTLIFNQVGYVTLTATVGDISSSVEIYYVGSNPVYVEVKALIGEERKDIPQSIMVGDEFELFLSNVIPTFAVTPAFTLEVKNQKTANPIGTVLEIDGHKVRALAGGTATLIVHISSSIELSFEIHTQKLPESVSVLQADTRVLTNTVDLVSTVLPFDATNQDVRYIVHETDIATIEGATLTFKMPGVVHITAVCEGDESVKLDFFIEKIEKGTIYISPSQERATVSKGDIVAIDVSSPYQLQILQSTPLVEGSDVLVVEGMSLRAVGAGNATVQVSIDGQKYTLEIEVVQLVENIVFNTQADFDGDEYLIGSEEIALDFMVMPSYARDGGYTISIIQSVAADGSSDKIAYKTDDRLYFAKAGYIILEVASNDGNFVKTIKLRHTGGDAVDAVLNVEDRIVLNVGESFTVEVTKWIPYDTVNNKVVMYEANASGKKIIQVAKNGKIVALFSGETRLVVELSNGIVKELQVVCVNKASDIDVQSEVYTGAETYVIEARVVPNDVTNAGLEFTMEESDIAVLVDNVLHFMKAGTVTVTVRTTDGSNIEKTIRVTSTKGHVGRIELEQNDIKLLKGRDFRLIAQTYPLDALISAVHFRVLSQSATNGDENVISVSADGVINAVNVGTAVVRAYAYDFYGAEIYQDCNILVYSDLIAIDVRFAEALDKYQNQNTFVTSKSELIFELVSEPYDAIITAFTCDVADGQMARVEGNRIIFLNKGRVTITFRATNGYSAEKSVTYSFYYVGEDLLEATLDKSAMAGDVITLNAGESFTFGLSSYLPSDNKQLTFTIKDANERRNDSNKQVASFEDGVLYALNGGSYSFTLYVNGLPLESLTLVVKRDAVGIDIEGEEEVYISVPYYRIITHIIESDSHQTIGFKTDSNIATVASNGDVSFSQFGECCITVYVIENPSVYRTVLISYTLELQSIEISEAQLGMYVGEYLNLFISAKPANATGFEYEMFIESGSAATLKKIDGGYRLIGQSAGEVTVTARVVGKDISTSKTFTIYDKVRVIRLDYDATGDEAGFGGYRVFGTLFINGATTTNLCRMTYTTIPSVISEGLLEWYSSCDEIATVDQNGVVTFLKAGRVTITVRQKAPYEGASVAVDSYLFVLVDGINVSNFEEFKAAVPQLGTMNTGRTQDFAAMVLHEDITIGEGFDCVKIDYNLYGNGHMLDHSNYPGSWGHFLINRSFVQVDNAILRGVKFTDGVQLKGTGNTLLIENCNNILLYNTIIENAENGVRIQSSQVSFTGCILRHHLLVNMKIARDANVASDVELKDCIFTSAAAGVMFVLDKTGSPVPSKLSLVGEVRFYNFATVDMLEQIIDINAMLSHEGINLSFVTSELFDQVKAIANSKGQAYAFNYNNDVYYNFAVIQISASLFDLVYESVATVNTSNINPSCNYTQFNFSAAIELVVVVPMRCQCLTLNASQAFIRPGDSYVGNTALISKIKKPCRF